LCFVVPRPSLIKTRSQLGISTSFGTTPVLTRCPQPHHASRLLARARKNKIQQVPTCSSGVAVGWFKGLHRFGHRSRAWSRKVKALRGPYGGFADQPTFKGIEGAVWPPWRSVQTGVACADPSAHSNPFGLGSAIINAIPAQLLIPLTRPAPACANTFGDWPLVGERTAHHHFDS